MVDTPGLFLSLPLRQCSQVYENVRDAVTRKMTGMKKDLFEAAHAYNRPLVIHREG